jgi:hypothetical protein
MRYDYAGEGESMSEILKQSDSLQGRRELLTQAIMDKMRDPVAVVGGDVWIRDIFVSDVVFEFNGKLWQTSYTIVPSIGEDSVILGEPVEVEVVYLPVAMMTNEASKMEKGDEYQASDYLYAPDKAKPSTWKLKIAEYVDGKKTITAAQVGKAIAAVSPGGYRGQQVDLPADVVPGIKKKLRALWKKVNPDAKASEMPGHLKENMLVEAEYDEFIPLVEKALRPDNSIKIKVIQPGWGSSGYYPQSVLEADGPKVFQKGLKMYWNHPTAQEEADRPERDLRDLAAVLESDARWEDGDLGPGLYADAKVYDGYQGAVESMAGDIGVSIRALGKAKIGEAEGRRGNIVESLVSAKSIDFVTEPGAGGRILQLFEAARHSVSSAEEAQPMTEEEKALMESLQAENARLREAMIMREARDIVMESLPPLPEMTRDRLVESLSVKPVIKDGAIDVDAFKATIVESAKAEVEYLAKVTGSGKIVGMGESAPATVVVDHSESLAESFKMLGMDEKMANLAAKGR